MSKVVHLITPSMAGKEFHSIFNLLHVYLLVIKQCLQLYLDLAMHLPPVGRIAFETTDNQSIVYLRLSLFQLFPYFEFRLRS